LNDKVEIPIIGSGTDTYGKEGNKFPGALRGCTEEILRPGRRVLYYYETEHNGRSSRSRIKKALPKDGKCFSIYKEISICLK